MASKKKNIDPKAPMCVCLKTSDIKVTPLPKDKEEKCEVFGADYLPYVYANIGLFGAKMSGKTTVLAQLCRDTIGPEARVWIFSHTATIDPSWKHILGDFDKRGVNYRVFSSLFEDRSSGRVDLIRELMDAIRDEQEESDDDEDEPKAPGGEAFGWEKPEKKEKERPRFYIKVKGVRYEYSEFVIIIDDSSSDLKRNESVVALLKEHRHYHMRVCVATQYYMDLVNDGRKQIDHFLLFRGFDDTRLRHVYHDAALATAITFEMFELMYQKAVTPKFGFLLVDRGKAICRLNFSHTYYTLPQLKEQTSTKDAT